MAAKDAKNTAIIRRGGKADRNRQSRSDNAGWGSVRNNALNVTVGVHSIAVVVSTRVRLQQREWQITDRTVYLFRLKIAVHTAPLDSDAGGRHPQITTRMHQFSSEIVCVLQRTNMS